MGNNASKVSDIFYPDNPNRRARARQLNDDVNAYCNEFKDLQRHRDEILKELKPRLGEFLKKYGYNSPEELDKVVRDTLKGSALEEYIKVSKEIDQNDAFVTTIFQIASIISVASGLFLGGMVLLSIMTGGAALAAIGAIGGVLAVVALAVVLFEIFEGERERANMRKCIHDLSFERVKARAALEGMRAISNWVENIKIWLDEPLISGNEEIMKKKIEGDFRNDFDKSKKSNVIQYLRQLDYGRNAWTKEDPEMAIGLEILGLGTSIDSLPILNYKNFGKYNLEEEKVSSFVGPMMNISNIPDFLDSNDSSSKIDLEYSSEISTGFLELTFLSSDKTSCTALGSNDDKWTITYESGMTTTSESENAHLEDLRFTLKNITNGKVIDGCKLNLLAYTLS